MFDLAEALAAEDQPKTVFSALEKLVDKTIGIKLFTLMEIDHHRGVALRNYSNQPEAYPVSGEKPIHQDAWTDQVQNEHKTFVANSIKEIAEVFPDYELIQALGCESCLNLPIVVNNTVIGTLNCLHTAGHYTPDRVKAAETLKPAGAMAFLLNAYIQRSPKS